MTTVNGSDKWRLLMLDGEQGGVGCRIWGENNGSTLPSQSPAGIWNCCTRSYLRMRNLIAARGSKPGERMLGPLDYYGDLENPHQYRYTIAIDPKTDANAPLIKRTSTTTGKSANPDAKERSMDPPSATVSATWEKGAISKTQERGASLFPTAGTLTIDGVPRRKWGDKQDWPTLQVPSVLGGQCDLSSYRARIVKNSEPFCWTQNACLAADNPRLVRYRYEPGYAAAQIKNAAGGGGLFLERHPFPQSITPLNKECGGFVLLAKWRDKSQKKLELLAVRIPFGYTLLVEPYCVHGDANLVGDFLMAMTSNHLSMQLADTVFLKTPTKQNVRITTDKLESNSPTAAAPAPASGSEPIRASCLDRSLILNPFARSFWSAILSVK